MKKYSLDFLEMLRELEIDERTGRCDTSKKMELEVGILMTKQKESLSTVAKTLKISPIVFCAFQK